MTPTIFAKEYTECFGPAAPLPIAVVYSTDPIGDNSKTTGCMFKRFHQAAKGEPVTFDADSLTCGGGKMYNGLGGVPPRVFTFVSEYEHYKQTPLLVEKAISEINPRMAEKTYLNFIRIDQLDSFDGVEGVIFFVNPDVLSGLFCWANYDSTDINAVESPWGSGCSTTVTALVNENRRNAKHCFIGMLDISARPYFRSDILSFAIPMSRLKEMLHTLRECAVGGAPAWMKVKKRINTNNKIRTL